MRPFRTTVLLLLALAPLAGQPAFRLKSGRTPAGPAERMEEPGGGHLLVQFRETPGSDVREELGRRGIRVLRYLPDAALLVSSDGPPELGGLDVTWTGRLAPADKISPLLREREAGAYLVVFHADVPEGTGEELARRSGFNILPSPSLLPGQLMVAGGGGGALEALTGLDEVAYVLPASGALAAGEELIGCPGPLTENGLLGEFVEVGKGWSRDTAGTAWLNWVLLSLPDRVSDSAVRGEIERAIREWERYANVRITAGGRADTARTVAVRFARGSHGDGYPFDGKGRVLAHTFYPSPPNPEPVAGDMHFDADEDWSVGTYLDVFSVALHELGHALGLGHSDQPGAVMYPYYRFVTGLGTDDIAGVQNLYGAAGATPAEPPAKPPTPDPGEPSTPSTPPVAPPSSDHTAPHLAIVSPGATIVSTSAASIRLAGTAADNTGVVSVRWTSSNGFSGEAAGTAAWSATVPLLVGTNTLMVRAYDAAGNSGWRSVMVVRR